MRAFTAVAKQTVRASVRSRVFHVLLVLLMAAVFLLPVTVSGDGSATGQLQVSLTYSLGVVTALVSTATLWLSCASVAREIEGYQMHLVLTKPAPRWLVWLGKWAGVFLMNTGLFVLAAVVVLVLVQYKVRSGKFPERELQRLRSEALVGRRVFTPEQPDFTAMAKEEYARRKAQGQLEERHVPRLVTAKIFTDMRTKSMELPHEATRFWRFRNIRLADAEAPIYLRYRAYTGSISFTDQRFTQGVWSVRDPTAQEDDVYGLIPQPASAMSGRFHELTIPAAAVDENREVRLAYTNMDSAGNTAVFQIADGPELLVPVTGFVANYVRSGFLAILQLAFLAALGSTVGAVLSTPVAVFVAVSYLVIGLTVQAAVTAPIQDELGDYIYRNAAERAAHYLAIGTSLVVVSVDDFDASLELARGRLIEIGRIAKATFSLVVLRSLPLALLGIWLFTRRELGTVIRR